MKDLKQETSLFVSVLVFMSSWNFLLSWVEHEKSFITSGQVPKEMLKMKGKMKNSKGPGKG